MLFTVGDKVRPRREWIGTPERVPTGTVTTVIPFGRGQLVHIDGSKRPYPSGMLEFDV